MQGTAIVTQIAQILTAGLTTLGQGIGEGVSNFVSALAFTGTGENQTMSVYFVVLVSFAGVALAVGLTRHIFAWLSSLGGSN